MNMLGKKRDLLRISDFSKEEILELLELGDKLKYETNNGVPHEHLKGKTLGMLFRKASTRTRVSFEVGMYQLGGMAIFLDTNDTQMKNGEIIQDTARVLSRYVDGIMIRTYSHIEVERLAKYSSVPVINGLTDERHPCQVLADLMTIKEYKKKFDGLKVAFIGDGHNMLNSVMEGCLMVGTDISVATPIGFEPANHILEGVREIEKSSSGSLYLCNDPKEAAEGADVIITDVWESRGIEEDRNIRRRLFKEFQVNRNIMNVMKKDALVLHCLPAHREEEITTEIFEEHQEEIFQEAENRLHIQKAVMVKLMNNRSSKKEIE